MAGLVDGRRLRYLDAMGIQAWERRGGAAPVPEEAPATRTGASPEPTSLKSEAANAEPAARNREAETDVPVATTSDIATLDWAALQQRVSTCTRCHELVANRTRTVLFRGGGQRCKKEGPPPDPPAGDAE